MRLFFRKPAPKTAQSLTDMRPVDPFQASVSLNKKGAALLASQLERDIDGRARGWNPIPYTRLQLLEFKKLLNRKPQSDLLSEVLYSHNERVELVIYAARYLVRARDIEDVETASAYNALIISLTDLSTLIKLPL